MRASDIVYGIIIFLFGLVLVAVFISSLYKSWLRSRFWLRYGRNGKFILFVYSNSPNWREYIESNILPRIDGHAVTLNWSERKKWYAEHRLEQKILGRWAGAREFNPVAIVFRPAQDNAGCYNRNSHALFSPIMKIVLYQLHHCHRSLDKPSRRQALHMSLDILRLWTRRRMNVTNFSSHRLE
jgi:hypothetical protein